MSCLHWLAANIWDKQFPWHLILSIKKLNIKFFNQPNRCLCHFQPQSTHQIFTTLDFYLNLNIYSHLVDPNKIKRMILYLMEFKQPLASQQTKFMMKIF
jgi:hypothetical protein